MTVSFESISRRRSGRAQAAFAICRLAALLLLVAACSPTAGENMTTPLATSIPTSPLVTPASTLTPTFELTQQPTHTPLLTTAPALVSPVEFRCPDLPHVPLGELGLPPPTRLMIREGLAAEVRLMDAAGGMQPIPLPSVPGKHFGYAGASPDHKWFALSASDEANGDLWDLWISSVDGTDQWLALEGLERANQFVWVNNEAMIFLTYINRHPTPVTDFRFNPFSLERAPLPQVGLMSGNYAFSPDASKVINMGGRWVWVVTDLVSGDEQEVLPWVEYERLLSVSSTRVIWSASGVSAALLGSDYLEVALNLPPESLQSRDVPVKRLKFLQEGAEPTWLNITWWSPDGRLLAFRYIYEGLSDLSANGYEVKKLFLVDTERQVLVDYCLPEEWSTDMFDMSPDGKFVAWRVYGEENQRIVAQGTVVMEVATGRRAWLPNMLAWWAQVGDEPVP